MTATPTFPVQPLALPAESYDRFSHTVDGATVKVYAIAENWTYFVTDTPDTGGAAVPVSWSMGSTTVRRFPGDPEPYQRAGSTGNRALPKTVSRILPGQSFVLSDGVETRQFSYVGSLSRLYAYCLSAAKKDFTLISSTGKPYPVKKTV